MKRLGLAMCLVLAVAVGAGAHPPDELQLNYDPPRQALSISMRHVSRDMGQHLIWRVKVYKNDEEIISKRIPRQSSAGREELTLTVAADPGDVLRVAAFCSRGGSAEATLTVEDPEEQADQP